jgi:glycine cleavage system H protein
MNLPQYLKYTKTHEWVRPENDGTFTIGITHHAEQGTEALVIESVKAAAEVYAPVSGEVVAVNEALTANPELVNKSPYEFGWLFRLQPEKNDVNHLLDDKAYHALCAAH